MTYESVVLFLRILSVIIVISSFFLAYYTFLNNKSVYKVEAELKGSNSLSYELILSIQFYVIKDDYFKFSKPDSFVELLQDGTKTKYLLSFKEQKDKFNKKSIQKQFFYESTIAIENNVVRIIAIQISDAYRNKKFRLSFFKLQKLNRQLFSLLSTKN